MDNLGNSEYTEPQLFPNVLIFTAAGKISLPIMDSYVCHVMTCIHADFTVNYYSDVK